VSINELTIIKSNGGLGRRLTGEDHISAGVFYTNTLPSGFSTSGRIKLIYSVNDAETLGITTTASSSGFAVFHYHISEFFRKNPKGELYVSMNAVPSGAYDFAEVTAIQNFADGKIRQTMVFTTQTFATSQVTALQTVATALEADFAPMSILYQADFSAANLSSLSDLTTLDSPNVSVFIGQDGGATGAALYTSTGKSVGVVGAALGVLSSIQVHKNIGYVGGNNLVTGTELDIAAFANGVLFRNTTTTLQNTLNDKGYNFIRKIIGQTGTWFRDAKTSTASTSDYFSIENERTIDKVSRQLRSFIVPEINNELNTNSDGTVDELTIAKFQNLAERALGGMVADGEISDFIVIIDPQQNVLSTSKISITVKVITKGVAREIELNIGFTTKI
jgi:hypothetical protein